MSGRKTLRRIWTGLLGGILFLTACGQTLPVTQTAPVPAVAKATSTPSAIPTNTNIPVPTETPTISTFTPTFDARTILTVTPAPKAECPRENPDLVPSFPIRTDQDFFLDNSIEILQFLNSGGELKKAGERLSLAFHSDPPIARDVTGDIVPELVFVDDAKEPKLHIFMCDSGQYRDALPDISDNLTGYSTAIQATVNDLNPSGIQDILLKTSCNRGLGCTSLFILEWNGSEFINLIKPREIFEGATTRKIEDMNDDGILEVIIEDDVNGDYAYFMGFPWRISTHIYVWNGENYALQDLQYAAPEYRFQALQDGDRFVLLKDFDSAMKLYNMTISDKELLPYSRELSKHMEWLFWNPLSIGVATQPSPDLTEYPRLATYAYYRIMLLNLTQNHEADANTTYATLQQKFGSDPDSQPYVEMATAFWNAYQSTHKMYDGCAVAIQYATEHPEILIPLGSDYHGSQSHIYFPADVCPFR
jgi:hypothetical protein